ncbi:uncharacterized protein LOC128549734 [Mercenaria mercenaria]|uniref:uncharacterized protein LOC128549734 n=1 Tax=Mercenaria mercenaria TaxID=6596 RepID=UPI00234E89A6|nr:uncharacterized protein LOC128549734 [Mercenaria mercenaria]
MKLSDATANKGNAFSMKLSDADDSDDNAFSMKLSDADDSDDNAFSMKLSDADDSDDNSFSMKLSDADDSDDNSISMKLSDADQSGGNSFNMKLSDAMANKENSFSMKLSDADDSEGNSFSMKLSDTKANKDISFSLKLSDVTANKGNAFSMKLSDTDDSDGNSFNMKLSDADDSDENSFSMKLSDADDSHGNSFSMKLSDANDNDGNSFSMKLSDTKAVKDISFSMKLADATASKNDSFSMKLSDVEVSKGNSFSMKLSDTRSRTETISQNKMSNNEGHANGCESCDDNWFQTANTLRKNIAEGLVIFLKNWKESIKIFSKEYMSELQFAKLFPRMEVEISLKAIHSTDIFLNLFWPFVYKTGFMNQKLGLFGLLTIEVPEHEQKTAFYSAIEKSLQLGIPFSEREVMYSFDDDSKLIINLKSSGLLKNSEAFMNAKRHLFTHDERAEITKKMDVAMKYLHDSTPELHRTIIQLVACFAFYKSEERVHVGGTSCSTPGVIWLDPSGLQNASVQFFVEQIVHEYIHNSLCYAEMVHGIFSDHSNLPNAKSVSSIRRELRNYDKSFHAAYVSTGLVAFHARAGSLKRAEELVPALRISVDDLVKVNKQTEILTESGGAMLQAMVDFLKVIRLY